MPRRRVFAITYLWCKDMPWDSLIRVKDWGDSEGLMVRREYNSVSLRCNM